MTFIILEHLINTTWLRTIVDLFYSEKWTLTAIYLSILNLKLAKPRIMYMAIWTFLWAGLWRIKTIRLCLCQIFLKLEAENNQICRSLYLKFARLNPISKQSISSRIYRWILVFRTSLLLVWVVLIDILIGLFIQYIEFFGYLIDISCQILWLFLKILICGFF